MFNYILTLTVFVCMTRHHLSAPTDSQKLSLEHNCADADVLTCTDPYFCVELINCQCKPGWAGLFCRQPCELQCANGQCKVIEDPQNSAQVETFCNCPPQWKGKLCDVSIAGSQSSSPVVFNFFKQ